MSARGLNESQSQQASPAEVKAFGWCNEKVFDQIGGGACVVQEHQRSPSHTTLRLFRHSKGRNFIKKKKQTVDAGSSYFIAICSKIVQSNYIQLKK